MTSERTPEQLNSFEDMSRLQAQLVKGIKSRIVHSFVYAEFSDAHFHAVHLGNEITFSAIVASNKVERIASIAGAVSAVSLRDNGTRFKLYIWIAEGPLLIVEQGARFEARRP